MRNYEKTLKDNFFTLYIVRGQTDRYIIIKKKIIIPNSSQFLTTSLKLHHQSDPVQCWCLLVHTINYLRLFTPQGALQVKMSVRIN